MAAHTAGDPEAFGQIVDRHKYRLRFIAQRITRNAEDAEDAVSDALVRAFVHAAQYRGPGAVSTWLNRIVTRTALDLVLHRPPTTPTADASNPEDPEQQDDAEPGSGLGKAPDPAAASDEALAELRISLHAALMTLEPRPRAAFFLVVMRDQTYAQAAELLDVPIGTVAVWVSRAKGKLAEKMPGF